MKLLGLMIVSVLLLAVSCRTPGPTPPAAMKRPLVLEEHGKQRVDEFYWLRERDNPEVIAYLEAENDYTDAVMADRADLREDLFREITNRIKPNEESAPYLNNGFYYFDRYTDDQEYPVYLRRRDSPEAGEIILIDVNELAAGHDFCSVHSLEISPDNSILAFAVDTVGRRRYTVRFKDLVSGDLLADAITDVTGESVFAGDSRTVFYTKQDPETLRSYQVWRHRLGADTADVLVYEEDDPTFSVSISLSKSRRFVLLTCSQTVSTEVLFLDADDPESLPTIIEPRRRGLEYDVDHVGDSFFIRTNFEAHNFRLMRAPESDPGLISWVELIAHREEVYLEAFEAFNDFVVVNERRNGLQHLVIVHRVDSQKHEIPFDEPAYVVWFEDNYEADARIVRFNYTSMTTPKTTYDYDMESRTRTFVKMDEVLGGFNPADYQTDRLHAPSRDGVEIPISLVYRKGLKRDGSSPLLLSGYGSYGISSSPSFSGNRLSLLDRGFVYAIAHVRGGQELGRSWYEDGKLLKKKNSFYDFIDCALFLIDQGYTSSDRLAASGGSAGGLLVGAVANMEPLLFTAIVAQVPWVDVVTTMLDDTIPLTTSEYDEWGDPNDLEHYRYMLSYSPYDNVEAQAYPNMLITAGLHDSQVQYWEPAKWTARLRDRKANDTMLLLKTNMDAGHGGQSGRFRENREIALEYAFIIKALGLPK